MRGVEVTKAETGRAVLALLAGDSRVAGKVVVEALLMSVSLCGTSEVLDALEMESRILWNLRLVVLSATVMLIGTDVQLQCSLDVWVSNLAKVQALIQIKCRTMGRRRGLHLVAC